MFQSQGAGTSSLGCRPATTGKLTREEIRPSLSNTRRQAAPAAAITSGEHASRYNFTSRQTTSAASSFSRQRVNNAHTSVNTIISSPVRVIFTKTYVLIFHFYLSI